MVRQNTQAVPKWTGISASPMFSGNQTWPAGKSILFGRSSHEQYLHGYFVDFSDTGESQGLPKSSSYRWPQSRLGPTPKSRRNRREDSSSGSLVPGLRQKNMLFHSGRWWTCVAEVGDFANHLVAERHRTNVWDPGSNPQSQLAKPDGQGFKAHGSSHGVAAIQIGNATYFRTRMANQIGNGWRKCCTRQGDPRSWDVTDQPAKTSTWSCLPFMVLVACWLAWTTVKGNLQQDSEKRTQMQTTDHRCNKEESAHMKWVRYDTHLKQPSCHHVLSFCQRYD